MIHREARLNGVRLHYIEEGEGPLVVLLHGFPEFWYSWRYQIPALAAAGFRVIAPDQRGYNLSEKPRGIEPYRVHHLVEDVAELIRHAGAERATVVGHDWGGGVAWYVPLLRPDVIDRLAILNAPHPMRFVRQLRTPGQLLRSWYMFYFQIPRLPEAGIRWNRYEAIRRELPREDIERYIEAIDRPGALTAAINYYRAAFRYGLREVLRENRTVRVPTILIWGERDKYLGLGMTEGLERWVPDLRVERIPGASHWVQIDAPQRVNELLIGFLKRNGDRFLGRRFP